MAWRRITGLLGLLVLLVLTGLPILGTICAVQCDAAAHHHGSAASCHEPASGSTGLSAFALLPVSVHDCSDHDAMVAEACAVVEHVSRSAAFTVAVSPAVPIVPAPSIALGPHSPDGTPPGSAPPLRRALVLRV